MSNTVTPDNTNNNKKVLRGVTFLAKPLSVGQPEEKFIRQSISFPPSLLDKVRGKARRLYDDGNVSRYLRTLIEADLKGEHHTSDSMQQILTELRALVDRYEEPMQLAAEDPGKYAAPKVAPTPIEKRKSRSTQFRKQSKAE